MYKALRRIEHHDAEANKLRISDPGDKVDYLPDEKAALYLELGIIEPAGSKSKKPAKPAPLPDAGADGEASEYVDDAPEWVQDFPPHDSAAAPEPEPAPAAKPKPARAKKKTKRKAAAKPAGKKKASKKKAAKKTKRG